MVKKGRNQPSPSRRRKSSLAVKRGSVSGAQAASDQEEAHHRANEVQEHDSRLVKAHDVPAIFLSHSGKQKAFVEKLYDALQSTNHIAFFDKHTLPRGSPFPPHIFRAVDGCKLGVVVLSDDFLTSKWPMLELERLVQKRDKGSEVIVLPLFYKLQPKDLKSRTNLEKWRRVWKEQAGENANKWEQAVKALVSFNGVTFEQATSEAAYIKRVVHVICKRVPSPILYDLSHIQGHQRLAQEVASQFRDQCDNVCMVGLYGVGGLGKTTMCKIMCNFYTSRLYPGRCCHIEFPSDGDEKKIVQECTNALKQLANLSDDHLLNRARSFDEVIHLMREHLRRYDVFLAIDNVWERSLYAAKRILGVSFSAKSKILLTSRSDEVLKDLLRGQYSNATVGPLPSPDEQEGFQIFQDSFELRDLKSLLVNRNLLGSVLKRCFFSGKYHALALEAVGRYVKRACVAEGLEKIEDILQGIDNSTALQNVEDLIRLNYVNLAPEKQRMFLDIVVVIMASASSGNVKVTYKRAHQWLSFLYTKYSKSATIANLIYELALDGLIQLENIDDNKKKIGVHDLYFDLAQSEAARIARFFTDRSATCVEEIEWEKLERVILRNQRDDSPHFIEELLQRKCRKLQVLYAENIDFRSGIHLDLMPSLCVLKLQRGTLVSIKDWSASKGLAVIHLSDLECAPPLTAIPSIPCLEELIIEKVQSVEGPPSLHGGQHHLKKLVLVEAIVFKELGEESWEASYFNSLTNLESLRIGHFNTRVLNLNALVNLQLLDVGSCKSIKRIEGLDALKKLQRFDVRDCPYLSNLDGLSGLLQLQRLQVWDCGALKTMPDLSGLTCLERLDLQRNESMEEVVAGGLSPALKLVNVLKCKALKAMPDLSGLTCLETLALRGNTSMEEVGGENLSSSLHGLMILDCTSLRRFPSLNECVHLEVLVADACSINNKSIENLPNLQKLCLSGGERTSVERLISWSCSFIENLCLSGGEWTSIERLISSSSGVAHLTIMGCDSLVKLDVGCLPSSLKHLTIQNCVSLEEIGGDLSALQSLELDGCESLTLPDVSLIPKVSISYCSKLSDRE